MELIQKKTNGKKPYVGHEAVRIKPPIEVNKIAL